jgi:hypothetical protein
LSPYSNSGFKTGCQIASKFGKTGIFFEAEPAILAGASFETGELL